jgi:hypothetical protein
MVWTEHVARLGGQERCVQGFDLETLGKETTFGNLCTDVRIKLRRNSLRNGQAACSGFICLRDGQVDK